MTAGIDPGRRLGPVVRLAPAKLNLTLAVVGRRWDGFHDLHSVVAPLALADGLSVAPAAGSEDTLHVAGEDCGPAADNLVLRAIAATRRAVGRGPWGRVGPALAARLDKRIPVAAGLGGGSSDAAAAIDAALEVWGAALDDAARLAVAAALGSDVPFFLAGGWALIEGRGERVTPLPPPSGGPVAVLLVVPRVAIPTPDVFAVVAAAGGRGDGSTRMTSEHLAAELGSGLTAAALAERAGVLAVANDLARVAAAIEPGLVPFRRCLTRLLGRPVGQSGSGPSQWVLYPSVAAAEEAARTVTAALADARLVAPGGRPPLVEAVELQGGPSA